jgi:protein SCO1
MNYRSPPAVSYKPLVLVAGVLLLSTLGALWYAMQAELRMPVSFFGTPYEEPEPAPPFALVNHRGEPERLEDHRGSVILLFFGFTHCPDVCPLTLGRLTQLLDHMGPRGNDVRVLLVTVDPDRDAPAVLAEYVARFGPRVTGLTGDPDTLESLRRAYGVFAAPHVRHDGHPSIAHTDAVFGIDRSGILRVLIRPDAPEHEIDADIRALLRI